MKTKITLSAICIVLTSLLISCGDILKTTELTDKEGITTIKKIITDNYNGVKQFTKIEVCADDHLTNTFGKIYVDYFDDKISKIVEQNYINKVLEDPKPKMDVFQKNKNFFAVSDINLDAIPDYYTKAVAMIMKEAPEYDGHKLHNVKYEKRDGKVEVTFMIEATKKSESSRKQGRQIITNYYEFPFKVNAKGEIEFVG